MQTIDLRASSARWRVFEVVQAMLDGAANGALVGDDAPGNPLSDALDELAEKTVSAGARGTEPLPTIAEFVAVCSCPLPAARMMGFTAVSDDDCPLHGLAPQVTITTTAAAPPAGGSERTSAIAATPQEKQAHSALAAELDRLRSEQANDCSDDWADCLLGVVVLAALARRAPEGTHDVEAISAEVHAAWMEQKRAAGVTSRKLESGEELMVPYAQLSDEAKQLDRATVVTVLSAMRRAPEGAREPWTAERAHEWLARNWPRLDGDVTRDDYLEAIAPSLAMLLNAASTPGGAA